jgi:polyisoprenoid-binding protein YceI
MTIGIEIDRTYAPVTARWTVDAAASSVDFAIDTFWGLITVRGHFDRFAGVYEPGVREAAIELAIEADSLDTGNSIRDGHLRGAHFFDVVRHPEVRFSGTGVVATHGTTMRVAGTLEAAGKSVPLVFDTAVYELEGELEITATTTVDQRLLGMSGGPLGMIRPPATVHVRARLV